MELTEGTSMSKEFTVLFKDMDAQAGREIKNGTIRAANLTMAKRYFDNKPRLRLLNIG